MSNKNPIEDIHWKMMWAYKEGELLRRIEKTASSSRIKVAIVGSMFTAFFIASSYIWAGVMDYFNFSQDANFIYRWIGFGLGFMFFFWLMFLEPTSHLPRRNNLSLKQYVEEVVYEDPKLPSVFLKYHLDHMRYEWAAFAFFWCVGYALCILLENHWWVQIVKYQHYWLNKQPSMIPIALLLMFFAAAIFGIYAGLSKPHSKTGKIKKMIMLGGVAVVLLFAMFVALYNAAIIDNFLTNFEAYSTRFPKDVTDTYGPWPFDEIFINWNIVFWTIGILMTLLFASFFAFCCSSYINLNIRKATEVVYHTVLGEQVESNWAYAPLEQRHESEEKLKHKIRVISGVELFGTYLLVFIFWWGVYWWMGEKNHMFGADIHLFGTDIALMQIVGASVLAVLLLWVLFLSPVYHYNLEKPLYYREKNKTLGYVGLDDRGVGSWRKFWDEYRFDPVKRRILFVINLLTVLGCMGAVVREDSVYELFADIFTVPNYAIVAVASTLYVFVAIFTLLYCITILRFDDLKDLQRGHKRLYSLLFLGFLVGLNLGSAGMINDQGASLILYYNQFAWSHVIALFGFIGVLAVLLFLINVLLWPMFIKYDDMYESIPDLIMLTVSGIVILTLWNYLCELFLDFGSGLTHHSWDDANPILLREKFHLGNFLENVFTYHYWGWLQELLFIGYWCSLSWKTFPKNRYANAVISACLFAMFHWDNMPLMIGTALGGFLWAIWWGDWKAEKGKRNLWMIGLMHGFNGSLVNFIIPMSMTVGPGGLD